MPLLQVGHPLQLAWELLTDGHIDRQTD
jgi:hypothetical protein